ncbi:MAG: hypothetical protein AABZ33_13565 [Chloroflexota bacterium]
MSLWVHAAALGDSDGVAYSVVLGVGTYGFDPYVTCYGGVGQSSAELRYVDADGMLRSGEGYPFDGSCSSKPGSQVDFEISLASLPDELRTSNLAIRAEATYIDIYRPSEYRTDRVPDDAPLSLADLP